MASASDMEVPSFFALEFTENGSYSTYVRDGGEMDGCIRFDETYVESPYTKFEAEAAGNDGLFHIRSCQNNKYWERKQIQNKCWITATAKKKEEDQTKASCTLFKFITVDAFMKSVRILHVQSGNYLCLSMTDKSTTDRCASADYSVLDREGHDILQLVDWRSLVVLPRFVAFKGVNRKYLCHRPQNPSWDYLEFYADDLGEPTVPCEVFVVSNGNVRIKTLANNKFWRRSPNWIFADSTETSSNNRDTVFRPFYVDGTTIGLQNMGNNRFCKPLTADGKNNCLNASEYSSSRETGLIVVEPILTRHIYDVQYKLDDARIYDETVLHLDSMVADNYTQESVIHDVILSYTETKTSSWNTTLSLELGIKATARLRVPIIMMSGKIQVSLDLESITEWGETKVTTSVVEVVNQVVIPPRTKVTVEMIATIGRIDVPFTYKQRDILYDGSTVITVEGGTYTGTNYYSIDYVTRAEKL